MFLFWLWFEMIKMSAHLGDANNCFGISRGFKKANIFGRRQDSVIYQ